MTTFASLELPDTLLRGLARLGFDAPTPVQQLAIPAVAAGADVAMEAPTGSGKTVAYALPLLQRLLASERGAVRVLIVVPTRELALQVAAVCKRLVTHDPLPPKVVALFGGEPVEGQIVALRSGAEVVVATPGRLLDLVARGDLVVGALHALVLDEADKLLSEGFREALQAVLDAVPAARQTVVVSATLSAELLGRCEGVLREATVLRVGAEEATLVERVIQVDRDRRRLLLQRLHEAEGWGPTLVFVATKRAAENLAHKLYDAGHRVEALHGGMDQDDRMAVLAELQSGEIDVLVATDLAARGLDIPRVRVVVQFDLPRSPQTYTHRVGRTARAGAGGMAVTFVDHASEAHMRLIEKRRGGRLGRETVEGFALSGAPPKRVKGPPPTKGKRKSKKDKLREKAAAAAKQAAARGSDLDPLLEP